MKKTKKEVGIPTLIAVALSAMIPGLGQIVTGRYWRGLGIFLIFILSILTIIILIGFIIAPIVYILQLIDAYKNTE